MKKHFQNMDLRDIRDLKDASINKGKRGIKHIVFGRTGLLLGFILLQVLLLFLGLNVLAKYVYVFFGGYLAFGLMILLIILNTQGESDFSAGMGFARAALPRSSADRCICIVNSSRGLRCSLRVLQKLTGKL